LVDAHIRLSFLAQLEPIWRLCIDMLRVQIGRVALHEIAGWCLTGVTVVSIEGRRAISGKAIFTALLAHVRVFLNTVVHEVTIVVDVWRVDVILEHLGRGGTGMMEGHAEMERSRRRADRRRSRERSKSLGLGRRYGFSVSLCV